MIRRAMLMFVATVAAACSGVDEGEHAVEQVDTASDDLLAGAVDVSAAIPGVWSTAQSETATLATGSSRYVAYNAHDPAKVTILPNNGGRVICKGATGVGYSYSGDNGGSWSAGKLAMPNSLFVTWGDPALSVAGSGASQRVFLSSLGITQTQYDQLPAFLKTAQGCLQHDGNGGFGDFAPISATIWRATPGGAFSLGATLVGADLDGGSTVSVGDTAYFGYWNVSSGTVLMAKIGTAGGASLTAAAPFTDVDGHPVLVRGWVGNEVGVTVVASRGSTLELATYKPSNNTWTSKTTVATNFNNASVTIGNKVIRGRGFAAHYRGANGPITNVVVSYQYIEQGKTRIASSLCDLSAPVSCERINGWTVPPLFGSNAFMPALVQRIRPLDGHAEYRTYLTYWTDQGQAAGNVRMVFDYLTLEGGQAGQVPSWVGPAQAPCPTTDGYWGDYDSAYTESRGIGNWSRIVRAVTDSTGAACSSQEFTASPQHVSLLRLE